MCDSGSSKFGLQSGFFHPALRKWQTTNTQITPSNLLYPIFISHDPDAEEEIPSMKGFKRWGINKITSHLDPLVKIGLESVLIFGVPKETNKDNEEGKAGDDPEKCPILPAITLIRKRYPQLLVGCDVCLCPWLKHGHCGIIPDLSTGKIDLEKTTDRIAEIAVSYAKAGCQLLVPSDMMDGRILKIKEGLKKANLSQVSVLSYSAKFASCLYGPFRKAGGRSDMVFGDVNQYQLPVGSTGLAMRAVERDVQDGADMLLIKPAIMCLDVVARVKDRFPNHPLFAFQPSGEYSMFVAGADQGLFDLDTALFEALVSLRRAGADVIVTYHAARILRKLHQDSLTN